MSFSLARMNLAAFAVLLSILGGAAVAQDGSNPPIGEPASAQDQKPLPPIASFMRSNSGWSANFSFADPVIEIQWSLAKDGPYESTGFLPTYDPLTRRPMANPSIEVESDASPIYVRYADLKGNWVGPFAVAFDPVGELQRSQRSILEMTTGAWLSFRHDVPNIIYYSHISSYRCAIREFRIGLDKPAPDRVVKLAPCDKGGDIDTHLWIDPKVAFASAQIVYQDGTVSKVKIFRRGETD
jgi:hypothetical protein